MQFLKVNVLLLDLFDFETTNLPPPLQHLATMTAPQSRVSDLATPFVRTLRPRAYAALTRS